jgi:HlyD family secretion protein
VDRVKALTRTKSLPEQRLVDQKFVYESRELELSKAKAELAAARAGLVRTRSLVGVESAEAHVKAQEAQLELSLIRAPIDGEILKVFTYPGERIGNDPILRMGDTADMHVVVEVHETDVGRVRVGQRATITSPALPAPVGGVVEEVGLLIFKNDVLDVDPRAPQDTRVVEVRVKLSDSAAVARFTHLEVSTRIEVSPSKEGGARSAAR